MQIKWRQNDNNNSIFTVAFFDYHSATQLEVVKTASLYYNSIVIEVLHDWKK